MDLDSPVWERLLNLITDSFVVSWRIGQALVDTWLWLTHWGRDKMAAFFQTTFSNAFSSMKMDKSYLKFH